MVLHLSGFQFLSVHHKDYYLANFKVLYPRNYAEGWSSAQIQLKFKKSEAASVWLRIHLTHSFNILFRAISEEDLLGC